MTIGYTNIEYGDYGWNFFTGCANGTDICATSEKCWARNIANRFHRDFTPTFHEDIFNLSFPRKPSIILVCFTGDVSYAQYEDVLRCAERILDNQKHTFLLLTKRPAMAYKDFYWPDNAWLGASLTGAETPERQQQVMAELLAVKGGHTWLSYEPMLDRLKDVDLKGINWLVMGAQTGRGAVKPNREWMVDVLKDYNNRNVNTRIWLKNNLPDTWFEYPSHRRQERPF